jgi:hypothetical protein
LVLKCVWKAEEVASGKNIKLIDDDYIGESRLRVLDQCWVGIISPMIPLGFWAGSYIEIDGSHPLWEVRSVGPLARENWVKW